VYAHNRFSAQRALLAAAVAVATSIGGDSVHSLGYMYALVPTGLGAVLLLLVALVVKTSPRAGVIRNFGFDGDET
jgi:CBS-domain-containing membrane protein